MIREEHVGRLEVLAFAVVEIEDKVVLSDEVAGEEAEEAGGLINCVVGTLQFDEGSDGGLIVIDQEVFGPFEAGWEFVGCAEFFIAEPAAQAKAFEDLLKGGGIGEGSFEFFADLVAAVGRRSGGTDSELFGWRFEGEEVTFRGLLRRGLPGSSSGGRCLGANAKELTVFGEATVGGVEDEVDLVDAREGGFGAEFCKSPKEGLGVGDAELDFDFVRHGFKQKA